MPAKSVLDDRFSIDGPSSALASLDGSSHDGSNAGAAAAISSPEQAIQEAARERAKVEQVAQEEARKAKIWRRNVFAFMLLTGTCLTVITFLFLQRQQQQDFERSVSLMRCITIVPGLYCCFSHHSYLKLCAKFRILFSSNT